MTSQANANTDSTISLDITWGTTVMQVRRAHAHENLTADREITVSGYYKLSYPLADGCDYVWCSWHNGRMKSDHVARIVGELTDAQLSEVLRADERSGEYQSLLRKFVG